jgi:hypothetical protein
MGRADYNEAINKTEDKQMLMSIVKGRYGETFSLLAVSGVTANIRFRTNAGVQAGFGPSESYAGNLVPFSGGLAYEENPTFAYSPVQGEQYLRQLMSPIPLDILLLLVRSGTYSATYLNLIANRINGMRNPDFLDAEPDPRFQRFPELNFELYKAGILQWVADSKKEIGYEVWITGYAPNYSEKVREYLDLLGIPLMAERKLPVCVTWVSRKSPRSWGRVWRPSRCGLRPSSSTSGWDRRGSLSGSARKTTRNENNKLAVGGYITPAE